jgi:hypothetical protein
MAWHKFESRAARIVSAAGVAFAPGARFCSRRPDCVAGVRGLELGNVALQNASPTKSLGCQNVLEKQGVRPRFQKTDISEFESSHPSHGVSLSSSFESLGVPRSRRYTIAAADSCITRCVESSTRTGSVRVRATRASSALRASCRSVAIPAAFLLAFLGMELRLAGHPSAIAPAWDIVRATFALAFALGRCLHAHFSHAAMERSWLFSMTY